ncbi:hypothetical protein BDZ89DRAFT_1260235 [Hymenopellis radicata]|nr:hypothetical protein BDZ89DRAFT_1260235 [Hymenopellis radicata]
MFSPHEQVLRVRLERVLNEWVLNERTHGGSSTPTTSLLTPPPTPPRDQPSPTASSDSSSSSSADELPMTPSLPPTPSQKFNARTASLQCRLIDGYVSFAAIEDLGAPLVWCVHSLDDGTEAFNVLFQDCVLYDASAPRVGSLSRKATELRWSNTRDIDNNHDLLFTSIIDERDSQHGRGYRQHKKVDVNGVPTRGHNKAVERSVFVFLLLSHAVLRWVHGDDGI